MVYPVRPYPIKRLNGTWYWCDPKTNKEVKSMNDRIDEIAWEAGCHTTSRYDPVLPAGNGWIINQETLDKFAELIVQECAGIYSRIDNGNLHMGTDNYLEALQKHFGVEE